jgi:hypothetical protein
MPLAPNDERLRDMALRNGWDNPELCGHHGGGINVYLNPADLSWNARLSQEHEYVKKRKEKKEKKNKEKREKGKGKERREKRKEKSEKGKREKKRKIKKRKDKKIKKKGRK